MHTDSWNTVIENLGISNIANHNGSLIQNKTTKQQKKAPNNNNNKKKPQLQTTKQKTQTKKNKKTTKQNSTYHIIDPLISRLQ